MSWKSGNVPQGGILHPAKASYNDHTSSFLKLLTEESKMSIFQRDTKKYLFRNGHQKNGSKTSKKLVQISPSSSGRRSLSCIKESGVYEREQFVPKVPRVDREKEKELLQDKMAYNEDVGTLVSKKLSKSPSCKQEDREEPNRFDEILKEIKQREEWLKEMERLGQGSKYKLIIQQQIQDKIAEMNRLKS